MWRFDIKERDRLEHRELVESGIFTNHDGLCQAHRIDKNIQGPVSGYGDKPFRAQKVMRSIKKELER